MNRRTFLNVSTGAGGSLLLAGAATGADRPPPIDPVTPQPRPASHALPDLAPAKWVWYPSGRTLQNTFVLFRRALTLPAPPRRATGWIAADSRYRLDVNAQRVQWGPPPSDPRWAEADPVDLTHLLKPGQNVLGATVLYYGQGDGTWPIGLPGFLFRLEIEHADGRKEVVASDASWRVCLARAWPPGHYKRWYLRALQEEFDARLYPYGWNEPAFTPTDDWLPAMELPGSPNTPALSAGLDDYQLGYGSLPAGTELRPRSIPLMRETLVPARRLVENHAITWSRPPVEYFEFRTPNAFRAEARPLPKEDASGCSRIDLDGTHGVALTFELAEQVVGWPYFTIDAPAGTTVELLVHEAHQVGGPPLLNTHFDSWSRFVCREGTNRFETFDFESLRWLQLHIHGAKGRVTIRDVGVRRRVFPWPNEPHVRTSEPALQRLFDASFNTLNNSAQETVMDGGGRERQQYSGDGAHQLHAIHLGFGETRLPARFLTTFSQGITLDGYFLDCWPAYDRLARLMERQLQLSGWGPILDHGVGFNFDCWYHYQYTGNLDALREPYPRLIRFARYLQSIVGPDGLLPVENVGIPSVWIDHIAYQKQRHKQCAFNLYAAAMLQHALAPICRAFGDEKQALASHEFGASLQGAALKRFWSRERGLFVNNLPWLDEERSARTCDRSLATAILFDQCPDGRTGPALRSLVECPPEMGFSYPANAIWRLWALGKAGRADVIVRDLRDRWATMASVAQNNTLQEDWQAAPDSGAEWSHCPLAPLIVAFHTLMGLRPLEPGFHRAELRPQLGGLADLDLTAHTVRGPFRFEAHGKPGARLITIATPAGCATDLVVRREEALDLERAEGPAPEGHVRHRLPLGKPVTILLKHT